MNSSALPQKELIRIFTDESDLLVFTDIEANGLGDNTFPIEIGWADMNLVSNNFLIRPHSDWTRDLWSCEAEKIHNITWDQLMDEGIPPREAAERVIEAFKGKLIVSDAPYWEAKWFSILFKSVGVEADFVRPGLDPDNITTSILSAIACYEAAASFLEKEETDIVKILEKIDETMSVVEKYFPHTHRAGDDAVGLAAKFKAVFQPDWDFRGVESDIGNM